MSSLDTLATVLPGYITEQTSLIPALLQAYYTWLDQQSVADLTKIRSVETTPYLDDLVREFVVGISTTDQTDIPLLVNNVIDIYRMKGTPVGIDAFYRLVYGVEPEITFPRDRTFALSASTWVQQYTMETDITDPAIANAVIGQVVASATGSARVLSAHFASTTFSQRCILTITELRGKFEIDQRLLVGTYSFKPLGSLGAFRLVSLNAEIDSQTLTARSDTGSSARVYARANTVESSAISVRVLDGGSGYSLTPTFNISNVIVDVANLAFSNTNAVAPGANVTQTAYYGEFIYEPAANVPAGATITLRNGATNVATANVVALEPSTSLGQRLLLTSSAAAANITGANGFLHGANTYANVTFTDATATGKIVAFDDVFTLQVANQVAAINTGDSLYQYSGATLVASGIVTSKPTTDTVTVERTSGVFNAATATKLTANSSAANVGVIAAVSASVGVANVTGTFGANKTLSFGSNGTANIVGTANTNGVALRVTSLNHVETLIANSDSSFLAVGANAISITAGSAAGNVAYILPVGSIGSVRAYVDTMPERAPLVSVYTPTQSNATTVELTVSNAAGFSVGQQIVEWNAPTNGVSVLAGASVNVQIGEIMAIPTRAAPGYIGVITDILPSTTNVNRRIIMNQAAGALNIAAQGWTSGQTFGSNLTFSFANAVIGYGNVESVHATITSIANNVLTCSTNMRSAIAQWTANSVAASDDRFYQANVTAVNYLTSNIAGSNAKLKVSLAPTDVNTHTLSVKDSGQGFVTGQFVTLFDDRGVAVGNAVAIASALGTVPGLSTNDRSKLAVGQHLHDGKYYQQFAVNISSSIQPDKYPVNQQFTDIAGFENISTPLIRTMNDLQVQVSSAQVGTR